MWGKFLLRWQFTFSSGWGERNTASIEALLASNFSHVLQEALLSNNSSLSGRVVWDYLGGFARILSELEWFVKTVNLDLRRKKKMLRICAQSGQLVWVRPNVGYGGFVCTRRYEFCCWPTNTSLENMLNNNVVVCHTGMTLRPNGGIPPVPGQQQALCRNTRSTLRYTCLFFCRASINDKHLLIVQSPSLLHERVSSTLPC